MATNVILLARQGMNVATWNVNGIRARASQVREWLGRERPDVVCLQELKAEPAQIPEECRLAEYHAYWHGRKGYSGVSLLIRRSEEHTSELQSQSKLVCRLLLEKKKKIRAIDD